MTSKHETHRGLLPLAGVCTMEAAMNPGVSVEKCVTRLKRFHYAFKRLHQITNARITAEPIYELKSAFSYHSYLCAEQVTAMRTRVAEMRTPPLHLDVVPDERLEILFDEILCSPSTESLVLGLYDVALPAIREGLQHHIDTTNKLVDQPSVRVCRHAIADIDEMLTFGQQAIACLITSEHRNELEDWLQTLNQFIEASGGIAVQHEPTDTAPSRQFSIDPYVYDGTPKRDDRFQDPYNAGVNAEAFLYDESMPSRAKTLMMYYKRIREIDVPEMMASIIHEVDEQPWGFYHEMTRQLWDEARHALMGEVGFTAQGVDWRQIPINFTWSLNLNTQLTPQERHVVLFFIEQGLMTKTGKRYEWEVGSESGDPLAELFQDFDWADEVLHADIGRRWLVPQYESKQAALDHGDKSWGRVMTHWAKYRDDGLTQHRNWWPDVYSAACVAWGVEPDPNVLAFDETYETTRADLRTSRPPADKDTHRMRPWKLDELNYADAKASAYSVAVLPLGCTEPHNLHLPYGTDTFEANIIGEQICEAAHEKGANVLLLPTIPYGTTSNQRECALSINVYPSTLYAIVTDIVDSLLGHGISRIVLLNSHGGNDMKPLLRELYGKRPEASMYLVNWYQVVQDVYREIFEQPEDHAGEMETSIALAYFPEFVAREPDGRLAADDGATRPSRYEAINEGWVSITRPWHELTTNTGSGNPHAATADKGHAVMQVLVDRIAPFLVELAAT